MHNLFLGIAKKMTEILKADENISLSNKLVEIREKVDAFVVPKGLGRLPFKILSGFAGFTAEQWKNWILFYSLYSLKGVIPTEHYQCWQLFSKACFYLCRREVNSDEVNMANSLFEEFCHCYVTTYGKEHCTMNLHLSCHLCECVRDYGPVYAFWLFAYERLNGILGSYHTNCRNISIQLTRRFLDSREYSPNQWPLELVSEFLPLLEQFQYHQGSLMQTTPETAIKAKDLSITPLIPVHECVWKLEELSKLKGIVKSIHKLDDDSEVEVFMVTKRAKAIMCNGFAYLVIFLLITANLIWHSSLLTRTTLY